MIFLDELLKMDLNENSEHNKKSVNIEKTFLNPDAGSKCVALRFEDKPLHWIKDHVTRVDKITEKDLNVPESQFTKARNINDVENLTPKEVNSSWTIINSDFNSLDVMGTALISNVTIF